METQMQEPATRKRTKGIGFGIILLLLGVVLLGLNTGMIPEPMRYILISWQMLLIVIGIGNLFKSNHHLISGTILIAVGSFFILPRIISVYPQYFPGFPADYTQLYWPLLLILAGILIIIGRLFGPKWDWEHWKNTNNGHHRHHRHEYRNHYTQESNPNFSKNSVFSSGEHIVLDPEFKGGEMNAVFGGISLDLRRTSLPEGVTYLEVNAVFGGITIYVPHGWNIETHLDTVFGGFQDNRLPQEITDTTQRLVIKGSCVFGGGELRN